MFSSDYCKENLTCKDFGMKLSIPISWTLYINFTLFSALWSIYVNSPGLVLFLFTGLNVTISFLFSKIIPFHKNCGLQFIQETGFVG